MPSPMVPGRPVGEGAVGPMAEQREPRRPIRVLIAEDHRITLWGLQRLIDASRPHMQVVGSAATRAELVDHPALPEADVVLLDLDLGGEDAAAVLAHVLQRCVAGHVLVLTGSDKVEVHRDVVLRGARGVLHKSEPAETILRAIEKVNDGEIWMHRNLMGEVLGRLTGRAAPPTPRDAATARIATLTPRERDIVVAMVRMAGAKQLAVADELGMSEHTLRNHLTTIYSKLAVHGRLELHLFATEHGLAHRDAPRDG